MKFTETTGTPITQLKQFEPYYTYSSETSEIIPLKGEVCVIYIPDSTKELPEFSFPQNFRCIVSEGAVKTRRNEYLIKIGDGENTLGSNKLPWAAYPQNNDVEYWEYFFAKWFCSFGDISVPTGQLYLINVMANTPNDPNLPLPTGAENLTEDRLYLKIGMGDTPLQELPWIGATDVEIIKNSINTYLNTAAGIDQIENITEKFLKNTEIILDCNQQKWNL